MFTPLSSPTNLPFLLTTSTTISTTIILTRHFDIHPHFIQQTHLHSTLTYLPPFPPFLPPLVKQQVFKENGGVKKAAQQQQQYVFDIPQSKSRPDEPTIMGTEKIVPSRYRQMMSQNRSNGGITPSVKPLKEVRSSSGSSSDDTALVQRKLRKIATSGDNESNQQPRSCPNSPICAYNNSNKSPALGDLPSHQEDSHSLKLMDNHFLQWRFANAKAEASMQAQKKESEMPYLDEWSDVEEDYSTSLTGMIRALLTTSLRLPVSREVRADVRELGEVLNSAKKVMEMIALHIQTFMPKAEELDALSSELAMVTERERGLIEECGDIMFKTLSSQVNEWSLRGHLIQLDRGKRCLYQQE